MSEKESTEKKIKNIRRQNRKKYAAEEKILSWLLSLSTEFYGDSQAVFASELSEHLSLQA